MSLYFCDTSAIIKRYVEEPGHDWIAALCAPEQNHQIYISQAAIVEVVATLCRKARDQNMASSQRDALINLFLQHRRRMYNTVRVTNAIYLAAGELCKSHRLRACQAPHS